MRSLLALALIITGCSSSSDFPDDFRFGAAVAGFQVDMGCPTISAAECEDPASDWYAFVTSTVTIARSTNFLSGDAPSMGPGFYELYEADLDRVHDMGLTDFRFSIEWSRIFPESTVGITGHDALKAKADEAGLAYYRRLLAACKARGIRPLVTLHHYTLPSWIHDAVGCNENLDTCSPRGWLEEGIVTEIAKYAGFVAKELGGEIDLWATQNEPLAVVLPGFLQPTQTRSNPPSAALKLNEAKTVFVRMVEAHARMYDAVKAADRIDADGDGSPVRIGLVYAIAPIRPKDPNNKFDQRGARNADKLFNTIFLDAIINGDLDDDLDGTSAHIDDLTNRLDYLGVNYYTRAIVEGTEESVFPDFSSLVTVNPLTIDQGAVHPDGFYEALMKLKETYPNTPLIVTENGVDKHRHDDTSGFLVTHLQWLKRALEDGANVEGYFYWSLLDNYEWNQGMHAAFGLYEVDANDPDKKRVARPVVDAYRQIATEREIPDDLADRYPIE